MYYLLLAVGGIAALFFFALFATQFWRLGKYLKVTYPVVYRLYAAFWFFMGFMVAVVIMMVASDEYRSKQREEAHNKLVEAVDKSYNDDLADAVSYYNDEYKKNFNTAQSIQHTASLYPEFQKFLEKHRSAGQDDYDIINELKDKAERSPSRVAQFIVKARKNNLSDEQIFNQIKISPRFLRGYANARNDGYSDEQIARDLGLNIETTHQTGTHDELRTLLKQAQPEKQSKDLSGLLGDENSKNPQKVYGTNADLDALFGTKPDLNFVENPKDLAHRIRQSRKAGYTDNQIYEELKNSLDSPFKQSINESINKGYTDKQISGYLGLKTNSNKNPEKPVTAQNIDYLSKDYDLKSKISTARISGLRDTEIYNQLLNSKTYGSKFQKALNSGFSKEEICFELGLKPE